MQSQVQERFSEYYERWIGLQGAYLQQLLSIPRETSNEQQLKSLVSKVLNLYKEYYTVKWAGAHDGVLGFFSSPWLTPLENAHLWITGWKPSIVYKLVNSLRQAQLPGSSLTDLTDEQLKKIENLRLRTKLEEERVEREMERQQVSVADRKMVELARLTGQMKEHLEIAVEVNGLVDVAVKDLLTSLGRVMKTADCVRLKTMKEVLEVLTPLQSADFVAGFLMIQVQLRNWGKKRDSVRKIY